MPPATLSDLHDYPLRAQILEHCKCIAAFDRDEAIRAFNHYDRLLPWLELRKNSERTRS